MDSPSTEQTDENLISPPDPPHIITPTPMDSSISLKRSHTTDSDSDNPAHKPIPRRPRMAPKPNITVTRNKASPPYWKQVMAYKNTLTASNSKMFKLVLFLLFITMCRLASVNTQGLRSVDRRQAAFRFFQRHKYDLIFLQETHWTGDLLSTIKRDWNGDIFCNNGTDSSRGVAILVSPHFNYTLINTSQHSSGRVLAVTTKFDDHHLHLVNLYAPNSDSERRKFFSTLEPYLSRTYNDIIGGDFNCIENPALDKQGGNPTPRQYALRTLHNLTSQFALTDIWRLRNPHKREFTWTGRDT